jgi:pimeloyl-ACP methyl ester carboxylesterase
MTESIKPRFVFIPGAGGMAWYWGRVVDLLAARQYDAIAVDLPADDTRAGLPEYTSAVVRVIDGRPDTILVAQSLGGFTAPLVCERTSVRGLIFVNAMIPLPGERVSAWWENTGSTKARIEAAKRGGYSTQFDEQTYFLHDVPSEVFDKAPVQRQQSTQIFEEACDFRGWPSIPIHVLASEDDRFFPLDFQRRVARERLRKEPQTLPGGHLVALSNPLGIVESLLRLARGDALTR